MGNEIREILPSTSRKVTIFDLYRVPTRLVSGAK